MRSEDCRVTAFFFFFAVAVLRFDFGILHGRMSFMLDCGWMFHTFTFGLLWFFFFCYRWCNRICFMFFVDGSWQVFFFLVICVI